MKTFLTIWRISLLLASFVVLRWIYGMECADIEPMRILAMTGWIQILLCQGEKLTNND